MFRMQNIRSFLRYVRQFNTGGIEEIEEPYRAHLEACALASHLEKQGRYPLLLFQHIHDVNGTPYRFPVLMNVFGSRQACAMALGLPPEQCGMQLVFEFQRREGLRQKPVIISREEAPVKEVVADTDLTIMPVLTHHLEDKGPYLTMPWCARDPESGVYNASFHRCYLRDSNHLVMFFERRHLWDYYMRAEQRGQPMPVACVVGHHPAFYLGNCMLTPIAEDEYESIGGLMGEPLRLVPSETFGDELLVPADAEIIIEGRLLPGERDREGPFGDFTGYYGQATSSPVVEVTAITHRTDAYFMDIFVGHQDHHLLGAIPKEGSIYRQVSAIVPSVTGVCLPSSGAGRFHCYVSIEKRAEGEAKLAAMAALTASEIIKHVIVADHDIDVFNEREVLWAVATRVDAATDVEVVGRVKGSRLDPVRSGKDWGSKLIIDACRNEGIDFPNRIATATLTRDA